MALGYFGKKISQKEIAKITKTKPPPYGTRNSEIVKFPKKFGFKSVVKKNATIKDIEESLKKKYPIIVNYVEPEDEIGHFAIVKGLTKNKIILYDPWHGPSFSLERKDFLKRWHNHRNTIKRWILKIYPK